MKNKWIVVMTVAALAVSLIGCGDGSSKNGELQSEVGVSDSEEDEVASVAVAEETSTEAESTEAESTEAESTEAESIETEETQTENIKVIKTRTSTYSHISDDSSYSYKSGYNEYDENGNITNESYYNEEGDLTYYATYEYGADGEMTRCDYNEYDVYGDGMDVSGYYICGYDKNGNLISRADSFQSGKYSYNFTYTYEYDENNRLISYTQMESMINTFEYDENGNLTRENISSNGTLDSYCFYEYDENGNMIGQYEYRADGTLFGYTTCEYDDDGNQVRMNNYSDDVLYAWTTYEYTYY